MNFSPNNESVSHLEVEMNFEELLERIENLTDEEKRELAQKLIGETSPLTVVLGGCNDINNSLIIQINNGVDKVSEQLEKLPPDAFQTLVEAIAVWIGKNKPPN